MIRCETLAGGRGDWLLMVSDEPVHGARASVVVCHDVMGDRCGPQRLLATLAARLARSGLAVTRFDYRGAGDSAGTFLETSFAGMCRDLRNAVAHARARHPRLPLALVGLSLGGVVAAASLRTLSAVAAVALVSADLLEDVRFDVDDPVALRGGELHLRQCFFREREALRPLAALEGSGLPAIAFHGARDAKAAAALRRFAAAGVPAVAIDGVGPTIETAEGRRRLGDALTAWLLREVGAR